MAQGYDKYELDNQTGQSFRFALNDILEASATQNSGDNSPNTTNTSYPYQVWVDTTNDIVKIRDAATAGSWYSLYSVDSDGKPTGAVAYGSYTIATNDTAGTGGTPAITVDTSQRVGIGTTTPTAPGGTNADNPLNGQVVSVYGSSPALDLVASSATGYSLINFGRDGASSNPYRFVVGYDQANDLGVLAARSQIVFKTDSALDGVNERFRITSTGILSVNETTPNANRLMTIRSDGTRNAGIMLRNTAATDVCSLTIENASTSEDAGLYTKGNFNLYTNSTARMVVTSAGYLYVQSVYNTQVTGSYRDVYVESNGFIGYLSSIQAHKANIQAIEDTGWLYSLDPVSYNRRKRDEQGAYTDEFYEETEYGLIAEQVELVAPQLCFYDIDEETEEKTLAGVHYRQLITPMLKALQQANERIETLEAKVAALESA